MRRNKSIFCKWCVLLLLVCMLSGCGKENSEQTTAEETSVVAEEQNTPENAGKETASEAEKEPVLESDMEESQEAIQVDSVEAFLEAIQPDTTILFAPGYYNFSQYIEEVWAEDGETWNKNHPYVSLRECFDGVEVVVHNVNDLNIMADLESEDITELVVETRYGAILNFEDCNNILLYGITMGHTQAGACDESVITFRNSQDISLSAMDLYGCGMYGFSAWNGSGNIHVQSSTIRECEAGPFYVEEPKGIYEFRDCWLVDSYGGGYFESSEDAELSFVECSFGVEETNYWFFDEYATFTDCYWEEITEYPDVEPAAEDFLDIDSLEPMPAVDDQAELADTYYAYMFVNQQSGDSEYYPQFALELSEDGTGYCESENEYFEFSWWYESDGTITLECDGYRYYYLTAYVESTNGYEQRWLMMQMNETVVWLY